MLTAISTGLKMDVPRTFLFVIFSIIIMSFYAGVVYFNQGSVARIVLYVPVFIYVIYYLKVVKIYQEFKSILNNSSSMAEFETASDKLANRADFNKLRKISGYLLGWATVDLFWLISMLFK